MDRKSDALPMCHQPTNPPMLLTLKGKAGRTPPERGRGAHLPVKAIEPVGGQTTESVTHGQCDARPTVTFPATERHRPLAGTKLYCLVTEAHGCEQLA